MDLWVAALIGAVVFALVVFDSVEPADANRVLAAVTVTIVLSVIAHGITAAPFATRYGRHVDALHPDLPEHATTPALRTRSIAGDRARPARTTTRTT